MEYLLEQVQRRGDIEVAKALAGIEGRPCISMYLPLEKRHRTGRPEHTHLRNLLKEAEHQLEERAFDKKRRKRILSPVIEFGQVLRHRKPQHEGLLLYINEEQFFCLGTKENGKEHVVVADRFYLLPLIRDLNFVQRVAVLVLSKHAVRLFDYHAGAMKEIALPEKLRDPRITDLAFQGKHEQVQYHAGAGAEGKGERSMLFHGHGGRKDEFVNQLDSFFRHLDAEVVRLFGKSKLPLVLAGSPSTIEHYADVQTYKHLVSPSLAGSKDRWDAEHLKACAEAVCRELDKAHKRSIRERVQSLEATNRVVRESRAVLEAASQGQVETLLLPANAGNGGHWSGNGFADLENRAVIDTLQNSGEVYMDDAYVDEAPCAILRYGGEGGVR